MDILVPISICAITPVAMVLIVFIASMHSENKRAEILIKAIEANNDINAGKLAESLAKPKKTPRQLLNMRLLRGCFCSLIGLFLIIIGLTNFVNGIEFSDDPVTAPIVFGSPLLAIGISYLIVYFVTRKQVPESEDK